MVDFFLSLNEMVVVSSVFFLLPCFVFLVLCVCPFSVALVWLVACGMFAHVRSVLFLHKWLLCGGIFVVVLGFHLGVFPYPSCG